MRPTYLAGRPAPMLASTAEPVVVAHTAPEARPTTRTLSFDGAIPIALIGMPDVIGAWLTTVIVVPRFVERYRQRYAVTYRPDLLDALLEACRSSPLVTLHTGKKIEVLVETFLRKQLGLKSHNVTKVEETERYMIVHIDRLGRRLLRCGVCRQRCRKVHSVRRPREWRDPVTCQARFPRWCQFTSRLVSRIPFWLDDRRWLVRGARVG